MVNNRYFPLWVNNNFKYFSLLFILLIIKKADSKLTLHAMKKTFISYKIDIFTIWCNNNSEYFFFAFYSVNYEENILKIDITLYKEHFISYITYKDKI